MSIYEQTVSALISAEYSRNADKRELISFKQLLRTSRRFGFPLVCTINDLNETEQMRRAAKLLISVAKVWPREDVPKKLILTKRTALYEDAKMLLAASSANNIELKDKLMNHRSMTFAQGLIKGQTSK
jgi:hypothetical protein